MTYETVARLSGISAMILFIALFIGVLAYTFWPGSRKRFSDAARIPLDTDPQDPSEGRS